MTMRVLALLLTMTLLAAPAFAGDVDGKWTGSMSTPGGDFPITFVCTGAGDKRTVTMVGMDGMKIPIANGKIEGDKISYSVTVDFGGMALEVIYKGVVRP